MTARPEMSVIVGKRHRWAATLPLFVFVLLAPIEAWADDTSNPIWQRVSMPKPALPKMLTKPAKPQTELPPKEAAQACIATAKDLFDQGYDRESILLFERARKLDPKHADVSRYLAVFYDRQNDSTRAKVEFDLALKRTPKDADLVNDLGYFYYQRTQWAEAEKQFRAALVLNRNLERAKVNLAMTLGQQGKFREAYDVFSAALGEAAAHSNVGVLLAKQGHRAAAIDSFHKALAVDPNLPQAKTCLACLERNGGGAPLTAQPSNQR